MKAGQLNWNKKAYPRGSEIYQTLFSVGETVKRADEQKVSRDVQNKKIIGSYEIKKGSHQFLIPYLNPTSYAVACGQTKCYAKDVWFSLIVTEYEEEQVFDLVGIEMLREGLLIHAEIKNKSVSLMWIVFAEII